MSNVSISDKKTILKKSNIIVFSKNQFSALQLDILNKAITLLSVKLENVDRDHMYSIEFQRSDIPRLDKTERLEGAIKNLHDMKMENIVADARWSSVTPFPKIADYKNGTIKLWMAGDFVQLVLEKTDGFTINRLVESFNLQGSTAKLLFDYFGAYKNRTLKRYEEDANILQEMLGAAKSYRLRKKEFFDLLITPAIDQINEKTSITVKAAYRKAKKRHEKSMYIFDVENKKQEISAKKEEYEQGQAKKEAAKKEDYFHSYLSVEMLKDCFPKIEKLTQDAVAAIKSYEGGQHAWVKEKRKTSNIDSIGIVDGAWYLCRKLK